MKVGVITFHHAGQSYGACLQALATLRALRNLGHEAELINYENAYEQRACKDRGLGPAGKALMRLNWLARMYVYGGSANPYHRGERLDCLYRADGQGVGARRFRDVREMEGVAYDVLLAGSDQIWNPQITGALDRAFLLDFGRAARRISYSSSMGSHCLLPAERAMFRKALRAFSAISVREEHARQQLLGLTDKPIQVVADPTMLLTRQEWRQALAIPPAPPAQAPYLLTYFVGGNLSAYWRAVQPYVAALGLPVHHLQTHARGHARAQKVLHGLTLGAMLASIQNAAFVITDSFHGTVFSAIFHKQFVALPNAGNPLRVANLLAALHLGRRLRPAPEEARRPIDYDAVQGHLDALRSDSLAWLQAALTGEIGSESNGPH